MNKRDMTKLVLAAALVAALPACDDAQAPAPQLSPPAQQPAAAQQQTKPAVDSLEQSPVADSSVPFILKIDTEEMAGKLVVTANIDAHHEVKAPTSISVDLPEGVTLVKGEAEEVLAVLPGGKTVRVFEVDLGAKGKLSSDAPVKVKVSLRDPKGGFGAFAERTYPEKEVAPVKKSSRVPKPPVARPGANL